jgi:hypothetical protein
MSGFSAAWLALREPADASARSAALASFATSGRETAALRVLDLGGGTGANIRYLSPRLRSPQHWTLVDNDAALLARAPAFAETHRADLNAVVDDDRLFQGCTLVTASALLDLVSEAWLAQLVQRCRAAAAAVLFALSYDGRIVCSPQEPEDEEVRQLVNAHQKTDKGFGPALGPDAAARVIALLSEAGYTTKQERTDWKLTADMRVLQRELVTGWAGAASEAAPERSESVKDWQSRRMAHIDAGRSRIVVGHIDVAGVVNR